MAWVAILLLLAGRLAGGLREAPTAPPTAVQHVHAEGPQILLFGRALDLNRASAASLEVLPGIGPARAEAIVRERRHHRFERLEDLQRVHGIGPRTVARLHGWIRVEGAPGVPGG